MKILVYELVFQITVQIFTNECKFLELYKPYLTRLLQKETA